MSSVSVEQEWGRVVDLKCDSPYVATATWEGPPDVHGKLPDWHVPEYFGEFLSVPCVAYVPAFRRDYGFSDQLRWREDAADAFGKLFGVTFVVLEHVLQHVPHYLIAGFTYQMELLVIRHCDLVPRNGAPRFNRFVAVEQADFVLRSFAERCRVCGSNVFGDELPSVLSVGSAFVMELYVGGSFCGASLDYELWPVCSRKCEDIQKKRRMRKWHEEIRMLTRRKRELKQVANCREQLRALRRFFRDRNPDHLRSLPEGFRPVETSRE